MEIVLEPLVLIISKNMQLQEMREQVASNINTLSGSDILDREVTSSDIDRYLNKICRQVYSLMIRRQEGRGVQNKTAPTYQVSGTASTSSTSTTLVTTEDIFSNQMVGSKVLNSTDNEIATITEYIDATTVTLDTTIDDTWDGDTIYIFTGIYTFSGDMTRVKKVERVGIKYNKTDLDYKTIRAARDRDEYDVYDGIEFNKTFNQLAPIYIFEDTKVNNTKVMSIKIRPIPTIVDETGIFVRARDRFQDLTNDTDEPNLPEPHDCIVSGATSETLKKMKLFDDARIYKADYMMERKDLLDFKETDPVKSYINTTRSSNFYRAR